MKKGNFIISLDFELHWGVAELWDVQDRKDYFDTTRESIPMVLSLFNEYNIHATWATVGFLFAKNKEQLKAFSPETRPTYRNLKLSYYKIIDNNEIGVDEAHDPYHYAPSLIKKIIATSNQELATHTFSHYYCNEEGQNDAQFAADLKAAQAIAKENFNIELQSLVFPRNQFNSNYVNIARQLGIKVIRSNPDVWFWKKSSRWISLARACDTLFSISKTLTFKHIIYEPGTVLNLPASRFLRPYTKGERIIHRIKVNRIKKEMTRAAENGDCYHLWWHPHNFGYSLSKNMQMLKEIIKHYQKLHHSHGFQSQSMIEMYHSILNES